MQLVIGNKNYSSWSLRPWLAMKVFGFEFDEKRIALDQPHTREEILRRSPAGKVPVLRHDKTVIWDSLAIIEYLAEMKPAMWPRDAAERARARSISAEMHSGFVNLRARMPMNMRRRFPGKGRTAEVDADIRRIFEIWSECRKPFLFGAFSAADAMYAPVVSRFQTYGVDLPPACRAYADAVLALPAMRKWIEDAEREAEAMPQYDEMYA